MATRLPAWAGALALALALTSCSKNDPLLNPPDSVDQSQALSGGATTVFNSTSQAFALPAPNLVDPDHHRQGDVAFEASFVKGPAPVNSGLGPIFNNTACVGCHTGDGRGTLLASGTELGALLMRVSIPGANPDGSGGPNPVPGYGGQVEDHATFGVSPEAKVTIVYTEELRQFADGTPYSLRHPVYALTDSYEPLPPDLMISPRMSLPVFGRGLLEAIPEAAILALADEADANGDGISGRPNYVYDYVNHRVALGRFGWKANQPTLIQQTAAAYQNDMGITSPVFPIESAHGQTQDDSLSDDPEISSSTVDATTFYIQTLGVPARRSLGDPVARYGEQLFKNAHCVSCHVQTFETGILDGVPEVSLQTIHPYTDMLLHDMGDDLADGRPDYLATGREWRTPPLWGIGLTPVVQGQAFYLHDGRARSLIEAIMYHGGEAEASREIVRNMSQSDRNSLLQFLMSL